VIAARLAKGFIHALLNDAPMALGCGKKGVKVQVKPILNRGVVDLGNQSAGSDQRRRIHACHLADLYKFFGRAARMQSFGASPRFNAPTTLVVIPEECQSMPITAPKD
jgi:hypothetical protein